MIFDYFFSPPLDNVYGKTRMWLGSIVATLSCLTMGAEGFWYYLRQMYRVDHIVVDAKNYTEPIGKDELLQVANYLSPHGTGLFGIILTRTDDDRSAQYIRREQWITHNKMMIVLNGVDLEQMLSLQAGGEPPQMLIQQKIEGSA
jgi:hypothetical protein